MNNQTEIKNIIQWMDIEQQYRNCKERSRPFPTSTMPTTTAMATTQNNIQTTADNE